MTFFTAWWQRELDTAWLWLGPFQPTKLLGPGQQCLPDSAFQKVGMDTQPPVPSSMWCVGISSTLCFTGTSWTLRNENPHPLNPKRRGDTQGPGDRRRQDGARPTNTQFSSAHSQHPLWKGLLSAPHIYSWKCPWKPLNLNTNKFKAQKRNLLIITESTILAYFSPAKKPSFLPLWVSSIRKNALCTLCSPRTFN